MKKKLKSKYHFPSAADVITYLKQATNPVKKPALLKAFSIIPEDRVRFYNLLENLDVSEINDKSIKKNHWNAPNHPSVTVLEVMSINEDGELIGKPVKWPRGIPAPIIYFKDNAKRQIQSLAIGDRVLAHLKKLEDNIFEGKPIKKLPTTDNKLLGVIVEINDRYMLKPIDKRNHKIFLIQKKLPPNAKTADLVWARISTRSRYKDSLAEIIQVVSMDTNDDSASLFAIHTHGIPFRWSIEALEQAKLCRPVALGKRTDLRNIPLITVDGEDARDYDDAIWAEPDPNNKDGWHLIVAIADVAEYVKPGSSIDKEALKRGNSTYFPERVVPMLPEVISNKWCSLQPRQNRPCIAVHMWIDNNGVLLKYKFVRGLMRSVARLTYNQLELAHKSVFDSDTKPLKDKVIKPLFGAFEALQQARQKRGALELEILERQILMNEQNKMTGVVPRKVLNSHQLIEEFMITANIAASNALQETKTPCLYRIHEPPDSEQLDKLDTVLKAMDLSVPHKGKIHSKTFNQILRKAKDSQLSAMINNMVLRTQSQARYNEKNRGHFGLALVNYTHFTSPIRRYSDLVVHRGLITALKLGDGGNIYSDSLNSIADHISLTERRSSRAERETKDRLTAEFLSDQISKEFNGHINGINRFALFVTLDTTGADTVLPIKYLPNDFYEFFESEMALQGQTSGLIFSIGDVIQVRLKETDQFTGNILVNYISHTPVRQSSLTQKLSKKRRIAKKRRKHKKK